MTVSITPRGTSFARFCKSLAVARGDVLGACAYAEGQRWADTPMVAVALKALTEPFDTAANDAGLRAVSIDLSEFLRPLTIVGRLQGLRRVPFRTRLVSGISGTVAQWVGEGQAIPVTSLDLAGTTGMDPRKLGAIVAITSELARLSGPAAEQLVAADVAKGIIAALDNAFIDPASGEVEDERPASITYGATQLTASGTTVDDIDADIKLMTDTLLDANMPLSTAAWILSPKTAVSLSLKRGSGGAPAYPGVTARGGTLAGLPVITSTACEADGSPGERFIALVEAGEVEIADDGDAELSISETAALELSDTPNDAATTRVSLWQNGLAAVKGVRFMNWRTTRSGVSVVLRNVTY